MSRKCSLAIESPKDTNGSNYPLNAFLVYNNPDVSAVSPCSSRSSCSSSPNNSSVIITSSPPSSRPPHLHAPQPHHHHHHYPRSKRCLSSLSFPGKSHSLPNLNQDDSYTHHLGNRRISICDLNNFSDEVYNVCSNQYSNLSTSDLIKQDTQPRVGGDNTLIHIDNSLHSFRFRNHKRRNSIALRFEAPKVL